MAKCFDLSVIGDNKKTIDFIRYLNSFLWEMCDGGGGSSGFFGDGSFYCGTSLKLKGREDVVDVLFFYSSDGNISKLEIACDSSEAVESEVWELVNKASFSALGNKRNKYFQRVLFCYTGTELDGEYWLDGFRIAPASPNDCPPQWDNVERYVVLDFNVEAIDENHARAIAIFKAKQMAARLSFLLHLDLYEPKIEHKWVLSEDFNSPSKICQTGYHGFLESCSGMPKKKSMCKLGGYSANIYHTIRYLGEPVAFPDNARAIFKGLKLLPQNFLNAFDAMCRMYQIAMQMKNFPTIRVSYLVSAVESIAQAVENAPLNGFSGFVVGYANPDSDVKKLLDYLYSTVRSAHFHAGGFPFGEHGINEEFFIFKEMGGQRNSTDFRRGVDLIRYALVNWVVARVNIASRTII